MKINLEDNTCASAFDSFNYFPIIENYNTYLKQFLLEEQCITGGDPSVFN